MSDQGDLNHKGRNDKSGKPGKGEHYKGTWRMVAGVLFVVMALYGFSNSQMSSDDLIGGGFWIVLGVVLAVWGFLLRRKRIVVESFKTIKRAYAQYAAGAPIRRQRRKERAERREQKYQAWKQERELKRYQEIVKASGRGQSGARSKRRYVRVRYGSPLEAPRYRYIDHSYLYEWDLPGEPDIGDWVVVDAAGEILTAQIVAFGKRSDYSGPYVKKVLRRY